MIRLLSMQRLRSEICVMTRSGSEGSSRHDTILTKNLERVDLLFFIIYLSANETLETAAVVLLPINEAGRIKSWYKNYMKCFFVNEFCWCTISRHVFRKVILCTFFYTI